MMGVSDVMALTIGEWSALCDHWNRAHGSSRQRPPTADEFDRATAAARGVTI